MNKTELTDTNAEFIGLNNSMRLPPGLYVVSYHDKKNARLVLNVYTATAENVKRIAGQIKMFKAAVFEAGQRLDDAQFLGA